MNFSWHVSEFDCNLTRQTCFSAPTHFPRIFIIFDGVGNKTFSSCEVDSCWKSSAWIDKDFESNTVSTAGEILLAGIGGNAAGKASTSGVIEVTRCTFTVLSDQAVTSRLHGYISELAYVENDFQGIEKDVNIFAGNGLISVNGGSSEKYYTTATRRRRLQRSRRRRLRNFHIRQSHLSCGLPFRGGVRNF